MSRRRMVVYAAMALAAALLFAVLPLSHTARTVALGGALLGGLAGWVGTFAVLRRQSLLGDTLSHAALPGVAVAFLLSGRSLPALLIGAAAAGGLAVAFIAALNHTTRIKADAAQGIALATWFALGIALLSYIQGRPDAGQAGLDKFIFGQAAAIVQADVLMILGMGVAIVGLTLVFWKQIKLITFDPEFAAANGTPVRWIQSLLSVMMVVVIVLGLQLAGVILMAGMLVAPPSAARQWTRGLGAMLTLSAILGAFAGGLGALLSGLGVGLPTGPLMIVVAFTLVFVSLVFAPGRGMLWMLVQRRRRHNAPAELHHLPAEGVHGHSA